MSASVDDAETKTEPAAVVAAASSSSSSVAAASSTSSSSASSSSSSSSVLPASVSASTGESAGPVSTPGPSVATGVATADGSVEPTSSDAEPACPPGFDPAAWSSLDVTARRVLAVNLPKVLGAQQQQGTPSVSATALDEASSAAGAGAGASGPFDLATVGGGDLTGTDAAALAADGSYAAGSSPTVSKFVSMSSLLRQEYEEDYDSESGEGGGAARPGAGRRGGRPRLSPEDRAAAQRCRTFFHEVVGSVAPLCVQGEAGV